MLKNIGFYYKRRHGTESDFPACFLTLGCNVVTFLLKGYLNQFMLTRLDESFELE
jgi:hypothetical protein